VKIHLITNLFHPDELAGAALYSDFARYLRDAGHEVRVTAAFSYYPSWKRREEDCGVRWRDEDFHGIPVRRISMFIPAKPRGMTRLWSDATFLLSILRHGRFAGWTPDVVVTACPMLSQCAAQRFIYRGRGVKRFIIVQDFVVDAALELGILKLPGLGGMLRMLEKWALRSAAELSTISPEMLQKLRGIVGKEWPLHYLPNWIHRELVAEIERQEKDAPVVREGRTLFYSGNLGIKQGLPDFMEDFTQAGTDWTLRIQGGGPEADRVRERIADSSIVLGPVEDLPAYVNRLRQCSACLVTQRAGISANFLPSKLLPALATRTPLLVVAEQDTPLAREITAGGYGVLVRPGDKEGLQAALRRMSDPAEMERMSVLAGERAAFFSRERVLGEYAAILKRMAAATESCQMPQLAMSRS
jgi:colanic acid biosynthesis glycosyl transferase WcaI